MRFGRRQKTRVDLLKAMLNKSTASLSRTLTPV
jgi:hypothetical protein